MCIGKSKQNQNWSYYLQTLSFVLNCRLPLLHSMIINCIEINGIFNSLIVCCRWGNNSQAHLGFLFQRSSWEEAFWSLLSESLEICHSILAKLNQPFRLLSVCR